MYSTNKYGIDDKESGNKEKAVNEEMIFQKITEDYD